MVVLANENFDKGILTTGNNVKLTKWNQMLKTWYSATRKHI